MKRLCLVVWLTVLGLPDFIPTPLLSSERPLASRIDEVTGDPRYRTAHWGLLVVEQDTGKIIYEQNADKLFAPASTTKLFSVAAALDAFGPDHRFETAVFAEGGRSDAGTTAGNIVLMAGGDLTLGGRTVNDKIEFQNTDHIYADFSPCHKLTGPDPLEGLNILARQVAASGIKRVKGEVYINDDLFDKAEGSGSGPTNTTPIMVNDNVMDFVVAPTKAGAPATVTWRPQTAFFTVDAQVETVQPGSKLELRVTAPADGRMVVRGKIPQDSEPMVRVREVSDPAAFARALFIEALQRAGIQVDASPLAAGGNWAANRPEKMEAWKRVALLKSPPFSEEAKLILKVSHNLHASAMPLLVAVKHGQRKLEDGLRWQRTFLERAGVDVNTISFADGAGGAKADFTTPRATVQLLLYMATRPDFPCYLEALPILGVDGTLATSVPPESPVRGKVRAKTGTLLWENLMNDNFILTSKALGGYLTTATDRKLVLSLMVNNVPLEKSADTSIVGKTLGHLCEVIWDDR